MAIGQTRQTRQTQQPQQVASGLEFRVLRVFGDLENPEIHGGLHVCLQLEGNPAEPSMTMIVPNPGNYGKDAFAQGNRVVFGTNDSGKPYIALIASGSGKILYSVKDAK